MEKFYLSKTEREWELINKRIKELGYNDLPRFLNAKISSLSSDFEKHTTEVKKAASPKVKTRGFRFSTYTPFDFLIDISNSTGVPVSTIIDRIIVTPLLQEH